MKGSSRIASNTAATYLRSVVSACLALFSSRWVLNALGATDFGLFSLVGSLILFLTFFNGIMAGSTARYLAFAIGKGDSDDVNRWFNTSLAIHLILPMLLIAVGWPIAEYGIRHWLTIPPMRLEASVTVFRISLVGALVNMVSVPFVAMFRARQRIIEISLWDLIQTTLIFILAFVLTKVTSDRIVFYGAGIVGVHILISSIKIVRALAVFPACRLRLRTGFDGWRLKDLLHFACWNIFGGASTTLSQQGSAVLLNLYHGPVLNAAFGIARQLSSQANQLSLAMQTAFAPEITASEGRSDHGRVMMLAHFSSMIGCIMVMLFGIPLIAEMDYILRLWLGEPPEYTAVFCRLILVAFLIERLTIGYMMAIQARGRIAAYQATVGGVMLLSLPMAWVCFHYKFPPTSLAVAIVVTTVAAAFGRVFWLRRLFGEPVVNWLRKVLSPCVAIAGLSLLACTAPRFFMPEALPRLLLAGFLGVTATALATWYFGFTERERALFANLVEKRLKKLRSSS